MSEQFELKLPVGDVSAKAVMTIKKLTGLAPSVIKDKAANDEYLVMSRYGNTEGIVLINRIKRELESQGITVRLYENGREETFEHFDNVEQMYREIDASDYPD